MTFATPLHHMAETSDLSMLSQRTDDADPRTFIH